MLAETKNHPQPSLRERLFILRAADPVSFFRLAFTRPLRTTVDLGIFAGAFILSYLLRLDFSMSPQMWTYCLLQISFVVLIQFLALEFFGGRSSLWRYTSVDHLQPFLLAAVSSLVVLISLRLFHIWYFRWLPIGVCIMDPILAFGGVFGARILRNAIHQGRERRKRNKVAGTRAGVRKPVLLIGAGQAGLMAVNEILRHSDVDLDIKGFIDDDPVKKDRAVVKGIKVLGASRDIPRLVRELEIDHVVITIAHASRERLRAIVDICEQVPVKMRIIPGLYEILGGQVDITRFREVQIEDLLGRATVKLDENSLHGFLNQKTVMVTGAGGSIGSELVRQIARFNPARLLLLDRSEYALFNIDRDMRAAFPAAAIFPMIADISDETRMRAVFRKFRPQVVYHAAAHKHVPLMEANVIEAIKNNVLATQLLGRIAGENGVLTFVFISTDKAVRPASVMGASKRLAELVVQHLGRRYPTRYVAVRFGNVIGSAGSVIPIFREQIRNGGPITLTDKRMKRYFMTIPEAAQLVLQSGAIGKGGEVFILDMGELVNIADLARQLITLSGLKPEEDIKIVETGIRPGEKLYEELKISEEDILETSHPKIFVNKITSLNGEELSPALEHLAVLCENGDEAELRRYLKALLPQSSITQQESEDPAVPGENPAEPAGGRLAARSENLHHSR